MKKIINIALVSLFAFALAACDSLDAPSPLDTKSSNAAGEFNGDMPGDSSGLGADQGLQEREVEGVGGSFNPESIRPEDVVCTVYFGFDKYAVESGERGKVKQAVDFFAANPNFKIILVGHTDWWGTEEYNMLLSDKRCKAVADYMAGVGADVSQMESIPRGELGAVVDAAKNSPEARHDRRVEIVKIAR